MIDDYVPITKDGKLAFAQNNKNELWVCLIEKAWAKLHGSYERIAAGAAHLTLRDLTGAPSYDYET